MVKFCKVTLQNFMAYKKAELDLVDKGLVLITGENKTNGSYVSNGGGKSSLVSAITYAVYGKTETGLKTDDIVNNQVKKDTLVTLHFKKGNTDYLIERYRKHKEHKNKVYLKENGKDITGSTNDVTDKQILDLVGIDYNTYLNAIVFGQGDIPMFTQATDKGRKEILESIMGMDIYKKAHEIAKSKIQEVQTKQYTKDREIETLNIKISNLSDIYNRELESYNQVQENIKQKESQLSQLEQDIKQRDSDIDRQVKELESQKRDVTQTFEYPDNYESIKSSIDTLYQAFTSHNASLTSTQAQKRQKEQDRGNLNTSDTCPLCGSHIDNEHKLKELESINQQIQELEQQEQSLQENTQQIQQAINSFKEQKDTIDKQKEMFDNSVREIYRTNQSIDTQIQQLKQTTQELKNNKINLESSIETLKQTPKPEYDKESEKDIENSKNKIKQEIVDLTTKLTNYENAVKAFSNSGIRSVILDFITPFLNEKANKYLQTLTGSDIELELKTQVKDSKGNLKDKFEIEVTNKSGGKSYKANSAGEKRRIDLAISFAIQDLIMDRDDISTNVALYDECFDGLDDVGSENVIKLLKERLDRVGTIFVISHDTTFKSLFENTLNVVKENGESRLEENS